MTAWIFGRGPLVRIWNDSYAVQFDLREGRSFTNCSDKEGSSKRGFLRSNHNGDG